MKQMTVRELTRDMAVLNTLTEPVEVTRRGEPVAYIQSPTAYRDIIKRADEAPPQCWHCREIRRVRGKYNLGSRPLKPASFTMGDKERKENQPMMDEIIRVIQLEDHVCLKCAQNALE